MHYFDHEKLDVYKTAIEFVSLSDEIVDVAPKGRAHLSDQLSRASTSIALNIAEGAGEFSRKEKARFYRIAKRSATECAAILDVYRSRKAVDPAILDEGRATLLRIVSMLIKLVRPSKDDA